MTGDNELREALDAAADEARRAGHTYIGTEHLLLGVLRQEGAEAVRLLASYGITYETVHEQFATVFRLARLPGVSSAGSAGLGSTLVTVPFPESYPPSSTAGLALRHTPKAADALETMRTFGIGKGLLGPLVVALLDSQGVGERLLRVVLRTQAVSPDVLLKVRERVRALFDQTRGA